MAFSPDGKTLATGNNNGSARLWDLATHQPIGGPFTYLHWVLSVAFRPDGKTLASGSADHTIRLWNVTTPRHNLADTTNLARYLCALAGRPLTRAEWARYLPHLPTSACAPENQSQVLTRESLGRTLRPSAG